MSVWRLFAFKDDDPASDETRMVAEWQIQDVVRWCVHRGFDHIYLNRTPLDCDYTPAPAVDGIVHHGSDTQPYGVAETGSCERVRPAAAAAGDVG